MNKLAKKGREKALTDEQKRCYEPLYNHLKGTSEYDVPLIEKAYLFAYDAHDGQMRSSGDPYITHPVAVACILIELGMDTESVVAGLLHDVVEDTDATLEDVRKNFSNDIALLVDGVTKLGKIPFCSREEEQAENLRKMLMAMSEDIRVIIIKLADRLHNMRTIDAVREQKRRDKSLETLEVYAPIAHRLGIRAVKEELEDLGIRQLDPIAYNEILENLSSRSSDRNAFLKDIQEKVKKRLIDTWPDIYIEGRVKSIHGIYRKMYMQGKSFDEIYDIYAVRIITHTVNDCYNILGIIHDMFTPIPGRFKDYISTPKPNMYQSLHTTVLSRAGIPFEVQIRTWDMHKTAEYGVAAHWKYKSGIIKASKDDAHFAWIRKLLESQKDADDVGEIVRTIKSDLDQEDIFVMSPKGDVINLPNGSTVIDFAYAIHSEVGNRMVGAKVNGRIVPIDYKVKTGEVVEILTTNQQGHGPSRDWLSIVRTSEAKTKIRAWFKKERRPENIARGKSSLEHELRRDMIIFGDDKQHGEFLEAVSRIYHCNTVDDLYATIGYGGLLLSRIMPRLREEYNRHYKTRAQQEIEQITLSDKRKVSREGVVVAGIDDCLIRFSHCCNPLPGDDIIGFITRGHGVSIHKRDCTNVPRDISSAEEPERWVRAYWANRQTDSFNANLFIKANKRPLLLADISTLLASMHVNIHSINARENRNRDYIIVLTVTTQSLDHLNGIITRLCGIDGVISVERTGV